MRTHYLIIVVMLFAQIGFGGEAMPMSGSWLNAKISDRRLPPIGDPIREAMLAEVHMAMTNVSLQIHYGESRLTLLAIELGDEQVLKSQVGNKFFHRSGGAESTIAELLEQATEPSVIAAVAGYLIRDEPTRAIQLDYNQIRRLSTAATRIMLSVAKQSDRLPLEVRQWARDEYYVPFDGDRSRDAVRAFWAENAAHFASKNYQAVRPPRSSSPVPAGAGTVPSTNPPAAVVPAAARPPAKRAAANAATNPVASPSKVAVPAPTVAVAANPTGPLLWPWLLLAVTSLGGWLWWRTRSAKLGSVYALQSFGAEPDNNVAIASRHELEGRIGKNG